MLRTKIRTGLLVTGGAAALLLLSGCTGGGSSGDPGIPTISETSGTTSVSPAPTDTAGDQQPTSTEPAVQPPTQATPASSECKVADLSLRLGGGDAAAGTAYRALVLTNKGSRTCTIQGF